MDFDLSSLDTHGPAEQGRPFRPLHPKTFKPVEIRPAVKGEDGRAVVAPPEYLEIVLMGRRSGIAQDKLLQLQQRNENRPLGSPPLTPDEVREQNAEFLAVLTVSWTFATKDGAPFPCTPANARTLWGDPRFAWMTEAALQFVRDDGNFLAEAPATPSTGPAGSSG